jgi:AcrR family transcriptional regulator
MTKTAHPAAATARSRRAERSDSIRNRGTLIAAAQSVLAAEGLDAPLDRIATAAGVGIATLYRHFPSRTQLWETVLEAPLNAQLEVLDRALADPDPWKAVRDYIMSSCALEAESDGYLNLMTTRYDDAPRLLSIRVRIQQQIDNLFDRARKAGAIRPDFTVEDLIYIMLSNSRIAQVTRAVAPDAWKRNAELFLDAIRPERAHPLRQPPMTPSQIHASMRTSKSSRRNNSR